LSEAEALDLVHLVGANALRRVAVTAWAVRRGITSDPAPGAELPPLQEAGNAVIHASERERSAIESVLLFRDTPAVREAVHMWNVRVAELETSIAMGLALDARAAGLELPDLPGPGDERIPVRITRGPLDFGLPASRLEPEAAEWYGSPDFPLSGDARFELVNFIDGERSVTGIRNALSAEFGPIDTAAVARYLDDLVEAGVVRWSESD
jgi:hypothetical protein